MKYLEPMQHPPTLHEEDQGTAMKYLESIQHPPTPPPDCLGLCLYLIGEP